MKTKPIIFKLKINNNNDDIVNNFARFSLLIVLDIVYECIKNYAIHIFIDTSDIAVEDKALLLKHHELIVLTF